MGYAFINKGIIECAVVVVTLLVIIVVVLLAAAVVLAIVVVVAVVGIGVVVVQDALGVCSIHTVVKT